MNAHEGHRKRKRSQFMKSGLVSLSEHEALEILLYYAIPRRDTNSVAHELLARFGSLDALFKAPVEEIEKIGGISEYVASLIKLVPDIYRKSQTEKEGKTVILNSVSSAGEFFVKRFIGERNEVMYEATLDKKGRVIACHRIGEGNVDRLGVNIRMIVETALIDNASAVMLAHNHPSGVALPSKADNAMTFCARDALETVSVALVDHIIVADDDYVSLAANGLLEKKSL